MFFLCSGNYLNYSKTVLKLGNFFRKLTFYVAEGETLVPIKRYARKVEKNPTESALIKLMEAGIYE